MGFSKIYANQPATSKAKPMFAVMFVHFNSNNDLVVAVDFFLISVKVSYTVYIFPLPISVITVMPKMRLIFLLSFSCSASEANLVLLPAQIYNS